MSFCSYVPRVSGKSHGAPHSSDSITFCAVEWRGHHGVTHQFAHGHKPFVRLVAPLRFGRAVKHIIAHVALFVHKRNGWFCQTAVSVVAHAFLRLGCFSIFSLWFRTMSDSVYQFVNATFHNGIDIAQHSVKHSFHGIYYNLV